MIKEKSAAAFLEIPNNRPPAMVLPLRENPGHKEKHWNKPILKASAEPI